METIIFQNVECNICREKLKVNFHGRNITFDCNSCKTYSYRRIKCSKCNEDSYDPSFLRLPGSIKNPDTAVSSSLSSITVSEETLRFANKLTDDC